MLDELKFITNTRAAAIKASTILSRGLRGSLSGRPTIIVIFGCSGKSLVCDAIAADLTTNHNAFHLSSDRFLEGEPSAAENNSIHQEFKTHTQGIIEMSFRHLAHENIDEYIRTIDRKKPTLHFVTIHQGYNYSPDLIDIEINLSRVACLSTPKECTADDLYGRRLWELKVLSSRYKNSPEIQTSLGLLAAFEQVRKKRELSNSQHEFSSLYRNLSAMRKLRLHEFDI